MGMKFSWDFPGISREFPGIFRSRKSGMEFSIYLHSRSRKWEWNLPFTLTFPFPKMGMEFAISRSRSRSPKVIPAHGWVIVGEYMNLHGEAIHESNANQKSKEGLEQKKTSEPRKKFLCTQAAINYANLPE